MRRDVWAEYRPLGAIGLFRVREYAVFGQESDAAAIQYVFDMLQTQGYETRAINTKPIHSEIPLYVWEGKQK